MAAAPIPPPMRMETIPYFPLTSFKLARQVAVNFAPVHARGWPNVMAPAVDIDFIHVLLKPQLPDAVKGQGSEGFINFVDINIVNGKPCLFKNL
jgi:hypothetical protein